MIFPVLFEVTHAQELTGDVHPLFLRQLTADAVRGEFVVFPAQDLLVFRAKKNVNNVSRAEFLVRAFDAGEELLGVECDVGEGSWGGGAVVAVGAGIGGVRFAEVVEKRFAAARPFVLRKTDDRIQMLDRNALFVALFLVDEIIDLCDVRITVEQGAIRGQSVASCASDLLIITLDALRQIEVNDEAHIRLVDAHAERDGGDDDLRVVADERLLILFSFDILQPRVIRTCGIFFGGEIRGEFVHLLARETINDARLVFVAIEEFDHLTDRLALANDFDVEILAVETGDEFIRGRKFERVANILPHARRGGGGERETNRLREALAHFDELTILGTKVVPPFRDAVRLVDGEAIYLYRIEQRENALCEERFRRNVEQFHFAAPHVVHVILIFLRGERAVDEERWDTEGAQLLHLIFHQRDQRRHDNREPLE